MDGKGLPRLTLAGLFIVIAVQIGGFSLLWSKDALPPKYVYLPTTADKTVTDSPVHTPVVVVAPPDEKALREIIQAVLEQELAPYARRLATVPEVTQNTAPVDPLGVKENSPDNIRALNEAINIVDAAIAQGKWTRDDTAALIPYSQQLTRSQRIQIMEKMGQAINGQELKIEDAPPAL
jgi:hypothetical protein